MALSIIAKNFCGFYSSKGNPCSLFLPRRKRKMGSERESYASEGGLVPVWSNWTKDRGAGSALRSLTFIVEKSCFASIWYIISPNCGWLR